MRPTVISLKSENGQVVRHLHTKLYRDICNNSGENAPDGRKDRQTDRQTEFDTPLLRGCKKKIRGEGYAGHNQILKPC